jgi:tetratricopeptide (TPR) repeat protein
MGRLWIALALVSIAFPAAAQSGGSQGERADAISKETLDSLSTDYLSRGNEFAEKGFYDLAIADYTTAIERLPPDANVYNARAWAFHLKGEDAKGLPDANQAIALAPTDAYSIETRAEIFEKLGERDRAVADYRKTLSLVPSGSDTAEDASAGLKRLGVAP